MEFWEEIANLKGRELVTLQDRHVFNILVVTSESVVLLLHKTGKKLIVKHDEIEPAYQELTEFGCISRLKIQRTCSPRNPAHVAAILAALLGVDHRVRPIELRYHPPTPGDKSPG